MLETDPETLVASQPATAGRAYDGNLSASICVHLRLRFLIRVPFVACRAVGLAEADPFAVELSETLW